MHTSLRKAVAAACIALATAPSAHAATAALQNAVVSASYNGAADGMLGLDHGYVAEPGSNVSGLDPSNTSAEFLTGDYLLAFDFAADGHLTIYNNGAVGSGAH